MSVSHDQSIPASPDPVKQRATALSLSANALLRFVLTGQVAIKLTLRPADGFMGYVQFEPSPYIFVWPAELMHELTALLAGCDAELQSTGTDTPGSAWIMQHAMLIARRAVQTCGLLPNNDEAVFALIRQCRELGRNLLSEHRQAIERLAEELIAKQELVGDELRNLLVTSIGA